MKRKDLQFWESGVMNNRTYLQYYNRLTELAVSMFKWKNLPEGIDERFLELSLFAHGKAVFFKDEELGFLCLTCAVGGKFNVYRIPTERRAYAVTGYNKNLTDKDSVIIWNNFIHTDSKLDVEVYSKRLYNLDRAIDTNANAQKTPIMILCDETQRLTMKNLYKEYDGNAPVIFGNKALDIKGDGFKVLKTDAPYVADRLYDLRNNIWNEAMTYLGIDNVSFNKRERLITDEVNKSNGGTKANRYSRLTARKQACEEINRMFNLDIDVEYRGDEITGLELGGEDYE